MSILDEGESLNSDLKKDMDTLDRAYPSLNVEFIAEVGALGPDKIKELSKRWYIPTHFMFMGSPGDEFPYEIQELGEVRIII